MSKLQKALLALSNKHPDAAAVASFFNKKNTAKELSKESSALKNFMLVLLLLSTADSQSQLLWKAGDEYASIVRRHFGHKRKKELMKR